MESLRGGALARSIPPAVQALWDSALTLPRCGGGGKTRTPADWALQWL